MCRITLLMLIGFFIICCGTSAQINNAAALKQYYDAGIPDINKTWSADEYVKAMNIIADSCKKGTWVLPGKKNNSFGIISKIGDYSGYSFLSSKEVSINDRIVLLGNTQMSLSKLLEVYITNPQKRNGKYEYGTEILTCQNLLIKLMNTLLEAADVFLAGHPDLTEIQKDGLKQMKSGLGTFTSGNLIMIEQESSNFADEDICATSKIFLEFYKKNRNSIDKNSQVVFDKTIKRISLNHTLKCIRNMFVSLQ